MVSLTLSFGKDLPNFRHFQSLVDVQNDMSKPPCVEIGNPLHHILYLRTPTPVYCLDQLSYSPGFYTPFRIEWPSSMVYSRFDCVVSLSGFIVSPIVWLGLRFYSRVAFSEEIFWRHQPIVAACNRVAWSISDFLNCYCWRLITYIATYFGANIKSLLLVLRNLTLTR